MPQSATIDFEPIADAKIDFEPVGEAPAGMVTPGNIDYSTRPIIRNPDGSVSTVKSISVGTDKGEVLIPTIADDGRVMTRDEALSQYKQTGKHLGIFSSPSAATAYAKAHHGEMGPIAFEPVAADEQPAGAPAHLGTFTKDWKIASQSWLGQLLGGPDGFKKSQEDLANNRVSESVPARPSWGLPLAKAVDAMANELSGGRSGASALTNLLQQSTREANPSDYLIPEVPEQATRGGQIAAGIANIPISFADFLLSPEGASVTGGFGALPKTLQRIGALVFAEESARHGLQAPTLQQKITGLGGAAAIGAGTAADIGLFRPDEATTAAERPAPVEPVAPIDFEPIPAETTVAPTESITPTEATSAEVASATAPQETNTVPAAGEVARVPTAQIATRPELMQYKAMTDEKAGTNPEDKITTKYDPLKAGNLLLWEPTNPKEYGLTDEQKYIVANGHHRNAAATEQRVETQNAQILRESAGFTPLDARILAAEANIADGKGTIYDATNFIRSQAEAEGPDAALERANEIGARGRKATAIALNAGPDLYASFVNEQITPDAAAVIADAAPGNESLQRLGIKQALKGDEPAQVGNFLQAVKASVGEPSAEQVDLFGANDTAIRQAEQMAKRAGAIQREIGDQIAAVAGAAKRPEKAASLGVNVGDPVAVNAKLDQLRALRQRANNWALDPEIRDLAMQRELPAADAVKRLQVGAIDLNRPGGSGEPPLPTTELFAPAQTPFNLRGEPLTSEPTAEGLARAATEAAYQQSREQPEIFGYGGGKAKRARQNGLTNTQQQADTVEAQQMPGSPQARGGIVQSLLSLVAPGAKGGNYLRAAETLGSALGRMHRQGEIADARLSRFERQFARLGVDREDLPPGKNPGALFASAMSTGKAMGPHLEAVRRAIDDLFQSRLRALQAAGAPLERLRENYFPGMWTKESREAFNLALENAIKEGVIKPEANLNEATAMQRAWVKARADQYLEQGIGSERDMLPYLSRRPFRGSESFRKAKVFDDVLDAQEFGLRPISNNPITLVKLKLAEIDRSIMAHEHFQALKNRGRLQVISPYEQVPEGWAEINDPYGKIYGPPTVTLREWVDRDVYEGMQDVANRLGIKHERGVAIGGPRLGYAVKGTGEIATRFATETSVLAHEIGHQLDFKYNLWNAIGVPTKYGAGKSQVETELRNIADLTELGKRARKKEEKMAQLLEAYIHAPEKMKQVAPTVYSRFDNFVKSTPELAPLSRIKPNIALTKLESQKYVGLPIMGRRIVPIEDGAIMNNYLSSSLYNSPYFGKLYKGWMALGNSLNQTQLGMGSAFHAGFTAGDAQVSAAAMIIKDFYGMLRGNRTPIDFARNVGRTAAAVVRTPIVGDRTLNAWRDPEPSINPRIAQVVKAGELAGARFELERGLSTEQLPKLINDWQSGHKWMAIWRSPVAATEAMAWPIMRWWVPRLKGGVFSDLASRIIEQNPGKSLDELTPEFRQAWNRVDARLGQVAYDRLFMNNAAKNVVQGTIRAPGWSGGTIAELGGAFPDLYRFMREWVQTGKPPVELPDRVAYTLALMAVTGITNGALTYAFTGQQPSGLDWFAFRDGGKDEYGNETRLLLPSYMKDVLSYFRHPAQTILNKLHPLLSMVSQLAHNKDYYGTEIRHPDDPLYKQGYQIASFVVKQYEPFWTRGVRREIASGAGAKSAAAYFGVMPAPRELTETDAERTAGEIVRDNFPVGGRTQAQADRSRGMREAIRDIQLGRLTPMDAVDKGSIDIRDLGHVMNAVDQPPLVRAVRNFDPEQIMRVWRRANPSEREQLYPIALGKIAGSRVMSFERKQELLDLLTQ